MSSPLIPDMPPMDHQIGEGRRLCVHNTMISAEDDRRVGDFGTSGIFGCGDDAHDVSMIRADGTHSYLPPGHTSWQLPNRHIFILVIVLCSIMSKTQAISFGYPGSETISAKGGNDTKIHSHADHRIGKVVPCMRIIINISRSVITVEDAECDYVEPELFPVFAKKKELFLVWLVWEFDTYAMTVADDDRRDLTMQNAEAYGHVWFQDPQALLWYMLWLLEVYTFFSLPLLLFSIWMGIGLQIWLRRNTWTLSQQIMIPEAILRDHGFSVRTAAKGRMGIKIGSHTRHAPKYLSVRHALIRMVLFANERSEDILSCIKSLMPKSILYMTKRLCPVVSINVYEAGWTSAKPKSEPPNAGKFTGFSFMEIIGRSSEATENESQHHSDPDSCKDERGIIKAVGANTSAIWIVATGAPHHATGNRALLHGSITEHGGLFVHAVDRAPMQVRGRGTLVTDAMVLPDVWVVPGLTANLVSVQQLNEMGYMVGFGGGTCYISSAGDGTVVGKARLGEDGLYELDFLKAPLTM